MKTNKWLISYDCFDSKSVTTGNWVYDSRKLKRLLTEIDVRKIQREISFEHYHIQNGTVRINSIIPLERFK